MPDNNPNDLFDTAFKSLQPVPEQQPQPEPAPEESGLFDMAFEGTKAAVPSRGLMGGIVDTAKDLNKSYEVGSRELGNSAVSLAALYGQVDPGTAADYILRNKSLEESAMTSRSPEAQRQVETIEQSDGFWNAAGNILTNPVGTANLTVQNLPFSLPSMITSAGGAAAGAAAGSKVPGTWTKAAGTAAGAVAGGFVGSSPVEIGAWVDQALQERGADLTTREGRIAAYTNPQLMSEVRGEAERKGITTAAVDSVWNLFAGSRFFKSAGQGLPSRVLAGTADVGTQMAGESASEAAGQIAAYEGDLSKVSGTDVALEGLLSGPQAVAETGIGAFFREGLTDPGTPAPPAPPKPSRDDLASAMESPDAALPEAAPQPAQKPQISVTGGVQPGDIVEHVNRFGEVIQGTVESVQDAGGGQSINIVDGDGVIQTVFEGDGQTSVVSKAPTRPTRDDLASQMDQQAAQAPEPPPPQAAPESAPAPSFVPEKEKFGPLTFKESLPMMSDQDLVKHYTGKNVKHRDFAAEEFKVRYPGKNIAKMIDIEQAAAQVDTAPTDAQKEAGNYAKGHVSFSGLPVTIENPKGSKRSGTDQNGQSWEVEMPVHYGYLKGTEGADGDHFDVFIGENPDSDKVYVVDQIDADTQKFDEHKGMMGFNDIQAAMDAYDQSFSDGKAEYRVGGVTVMTMAEFKEWLKTKDITKPIVYKEPVADEKAPAAQPEDSVPGDFSKRVEAVISPAIPQISANQVEKPESEPENVTRGTFSVGQTVYWQGDEATVLKVDDGGLFVKFKNPINMMGNMIYEASLGFNDVETVRAKEPENDRSAEQVPDNKQDSGAQIEEEYLPEYTGDLGVIEKQYVDSVPKDGKADRVSAKIMEAVEVADLMDQRGVGAEQSKFLREQSNSMAQRYAALIKDGKPADADLLQQADQLEKAIDRAHDIIDGEAKPPESPQQDQTAPPASEPAQGDSGATTAPAQPRGKKLQDVGEKMDGKRAFQDRMDKAKASEKAKQIIASTKTKAVFNIEKREGQTDGTARFAQALVDGMYDFSAYLKRMSLIKTGSRGRYGYKVPGWEEQIKILFSDDAEANGADLGAHRVRADLVMIARKEIIEAAERYIELGSRISDMLDNAPTIEQLKVELKNGLEEKEFDALFTQFSIKSSLYRDIFSSASWSTFGGITDETAVKETSRATPMIRPKLEHIIREGFKDYRNGRDVTPEEFKEKFGFRGVEFGEWVNAKEGQAHVNHAYDALLDLADRLGIKPSHISLGGKLGFAFGSRGSGEHAAHYEPDTNVINLTKTKGDGSVAHEWLHALDYNLRKNDYRSVQIMNYAYKTLEQSFKGESIEKKIKDFLKGTIYYQKNKSSGPIGNAKLFIEYIQKDPFRQLAVTTNFKREGDALGKDYWGTGRELLARAWEAFILDTIDGKSPYLVSDWVGENVVTKDAGYRGTPYPTGEERAEFIDFFNEFLKVVEFTDEGPRFKPDAKLPIQDQIGKIIEEAQSYLPKLADMMQEINDGNVQQDRVPAGVSDGDGAAGTEDVSGDDERSFTEVTPERDSGRSRDDVPDNGRTSDVIQGDERGTGEGGSGGDRVRRDDTVSEPVDEAESLPDFEAKGKNHVIAVGALDEKRGQKQKAKDNLDIIKLVKEIELANRAATPEEQALLAKYTGWGSVKNAFPGVDGQPKEGWADVVKNVKAAMTDKEYREARRSIQYAHYTSEIVVRSMWSAFQRFGLNKGTIFEPGMGIGNFVGMMPDAIKAQYSGLEVDTMTTRIARILYPESSVRHADFISVRYADNMFDAAIGNPPFSDAKVKGDPKYKNLSLHNYFFAKTIDKVAPGGVIAFVTSRYSMDTIDAEARRMMAEKVDLIGAVRLPDTAFKTNAHTEVVTDIIFLRKRLPGEQSNGIQWFETKNINLRNPEGVPFRVNEYFVNNPEMVLGNFSSTGSMYAKGTLTVSPVENRDLKQQLDEAIARLPENIVTDIQKANTDAIDMMPPESKEGSYYMKGDVLMQNIDGQGHPVQMRGKGAGGITKADAEKIKALIPLRNALRDTMAAMLARDDAAMKAAQKTLKKHHSAFVKKYGAVTKSETDSRPATPGQAEDERDDLRNDYIAAEEEFDEGDIDLTSLIGKINPETGKKFTSTQIGRIRQKRREEIEAKGGVVNEGSFDPSSVPDNISIKYPNLDSFKGDPEYYNLLILENFNEEMGEFSTTDIFEKNIIAEIKKPEIKTPVDALNYSLVMKNGVDPVFMAQELGVNPETVIQELEQLDLIYKMPGSKGEATYVYAEEYLSGYVKDKLAYAKKLAEKDDYYKRNVLALEAVQPRDIQASDINTQLGSPYFEPKVIMDFMRQELNISATVTYTPLINHWEVSSHDPYSPENTTQWGTSKRSATEIMASLLMRKDIKVTRTTVDEKTGKDKQVVDVAETQAAQDKAKVLQEKFDKWIWKSSHSERVYRNYNNEYNNIVPRKFDGKHITTAISPSIQLRSHQKNAIWRIIQSGNTFLAHAVGAGKTLEMAAGAMEMRRLGQWKKPMLVVPNHMLAQFSKEFREAYPQAKIMVADEQNFQMDRRKRFVANVAKSDWDAVIITYSSFKKIPISRDFEAEMVEKELDRYRAALAEAGGGKKSKNSTAAKLEKQILKMETRLAGLRVKEQDQSFSFEELGTDAILLDEAHYFRKLSFPTLQGTMKGVNPVGSKAAWDLYIKSKFLDTVHPGRNLVMASGTPLTNTLAEVFTIQRYMNERALEQKGLQNFDAWSSVFAAAVTNPERQPSGSYKNVTRLAEFRNLGVLSQMVRQFMDTVTSDELGALVDRPVMKSGSMIIKTTKPTREYLAFQKYLAHRTELVAKSGRKNEKGADNILSIIGEGRHAAIDMRLIDPTLPEMPSKLEDMIDNVFQIWKQTENDEFKKKYKGKDASPVKGGAQLIFSDLGIQTKSKGGKSFSAYDHIKRKLIRNGIPAGQIAFISDYSTTPERNRLQNMVRNGEIRILIGSTAKMGTGLNVQNRLKAVHNLDAPWLPADLEQRVGRALRQGNQYGEIEIYGYGTEGSYDSTMWGMLETKAKAIIQFLKGDGDLTSMRDIEETDHFRMAKAMTSGDPRVLKQAELQSEVEKLARQSSNFRNEQVQIRSGIASKKSRIEYSKDEIMFIDEAVKLRKDLPEGEFVMTVMGTPYTERAEAAGALDAAVQNILKSNADTPSGGTKIGEFRGFDVKLFIGANSNLGFSYDMFLDHPAIIKNGKQWESGGPAFSGSGAITILNNALNRLEARKSGEQATIENNQREIKVLESQITENFPKEAELDDKKQQLAEIDEDLKLNAPAEIVYDDYPVSYWEANKEQMNAMFSIVDDSEYWYGVESKTKSESKREKIERAVNKRLKKLGFPQANFRLYNDPAEYGFDRYAAGAYKNGLVYVSMTAQDLLSVLNHEVLHALKAAGAFSKPEWEMLEGHAFNWRKKYNIDRDYAHLNLTEDKLMEEGIAAAFQDYSTQGPVRRIINKVVRFLNAIRDVLKGEEFNFNTYEDVFEAVMAGEVSGRVDLAERLEILKMEPGITMFQSQNETSKIDTAAFKEWFGDSKVVDADGKPLVVYHGSPDARFMKSDAIFMSVKDRYGDQKGEGAFWFAKDRKTALSYADDRRAFDYQNAEPDVIPAYLKLENPLIVDGKGRDWREAQAIGKTTDVIEKAQADGHDGVIIKNVRDDYNNSKNTKTTDTYVVFDSRQIKSVNNRGTFDKNDARILYSLSKNKDEALEQAIDAIDGMDKGFRPAIGKIASYILHPHQVASLHKSFTPVYLAAIDMMKTRDVIVHKLSNHMDLYNKIGRDSKKKIDAVLEIGRLENKNFIDVNGFILAENTKSDSALYSKVGEKITLTGAEVDAYLGVRAAMDLALDTYMQTVLEEYGYAEKGIKTKADLAKALSAEKNDKEILRMQEAMKIIIDIENAKRHGYIPLKRWGEIGITVRRKDGEEELAHFQRVELSKVPGMKGKIIGENKAVREAVTELLKKYPADEYTIETFEVKDFSSLQAKLNLNELDVLAASSDMTESDYSALREMLSDAMARRGFRSHFFQSENVSGYSGDFERALNDYVISISGHLSRRIHIPKLDKAVREIEKSGQVSLFDYARKYVAYISDPVEEFAALRQMGFMWYLAGNVASGVTNATQPFMVTAPWFKAMFSHGQIAKQFGAAYKDAAAMIDLKSGTDVFNFDKAPDDVRAALKKAEGEGDFIPLNTYDAMAIANINSASLRGLDRAAREMQDVLSLTFSVPERTNRIVTYISAYRFAMIPENRTKIMAFINRDQIGRKSVEGKTGAEFAAAFADYAVFSTQLRMGKLNRPTLSRGIGTLPFQFMSFSLQMLELMYRLSKVHGGKKGTAIAFMLFAVVAMSGLKGFPFEDDVQKMFEAAWKTLTRTDLDVDSEMRKILSKAVGPKMAEAIMEGLPAAYLNVDMSSRLGYGNIIPDSQSDLLGVWFDMLYTKPVQAATDIARGDYAMALADVSPAVLRNIAQAYAWSQGGVRSAKTGDTIIIKEDLTAADIGLKVLGFTSGDIAAERSRIYAEQRASHAVDGLRSDYYDKLARAMVARNKLWNTDRDAALGYQAEIDSIFAEIARHNATAPSHKQIIINPSTTLKQRVREEMKGAAANKPRKQAREEAERLKEAYGR